MQNENRTKRTKIVLVIALVLILAGSLLASLTQIAYGNVRVRDIRFAASDGTVINAKLYVPKDVTTENPAPGILAIHGYINSNETQDGFAIEFARRGYVVLAIDESGHGYSDPPAFAGGFGGMYGMDYLLSLDIVDKDNIGLEGHSMGGWAVVIAAAVNPTSYKSMVLAGSSTGTFGAPDGNAAFPTNVALIFSEWDEFSNLMWGVPVPKDIVDTEKLQTLFGTDDTVVVGELYGSIEQGTARKLYMPRVTHPGDHISANAIGSAVEWFQETLDGGNDLDPDNQIWYWKEIGNLIALIGMVLLLFPAGSLLLSKASFFQDLQEAPAAETKSAKGITWWVSAIIFAAVPALTYFTFCDYFNTWKMTANYLFPESITTQLLIWVLLVGAFSLVFFLVWHFVFNRKARASFSDYGLYDKSTVVGWKKIGKSFLLAALIALFAYLALAAVAWIFHVDFRYWVFAVKPMSDLHFRIFLIYLIPFTAFFVVLALVLHGQLRPKKEGTIGLGREMLINWGMLIVGFVVLLAIQYIPLLAGGELMFPDESLFGIIAFQLLPIFTIVALVNTYFYRKTGHIYVGAFLNGILVTWIVVASQAIGLAV